MVRLYMVLLGCRPAGRLTEQHDVFFGQGHSLKDLVPQMKKFWPDSGALHIDAWREVSMVGAYSIELVKREQVSRPSKNLQLFFINLGGYQTGLFEELHCKQLIVAESIAAALKIARQSHFFKSAATGTKAGIAHVDDKYGFDLDDIHRVEDLLVDKDKFELRIRPADAVLADEEHLGYLKISTLK